MKTIHLVSSLELDLHSYGHTKAEAKRNFSAMLKLERAARKIQKKKLARLKLKIWTRKIPAEFPNEIAVQSY